MSEIEKHFSENLQIYGALASIVGALISVWQARRATTAKSESEKILASIEARKAFEEVAELQKWIGKLLSRFKKYGGGANPNALRGIKGQDDALELQDFLVKLIETQDKLSDAEPGINIEHVKSEFDKELPVLSSTKVLAELKNSGEKVFLLLRDLNHQLKKHYEIKTMQF